MGSDRLDSGENRLHRGNAGRLGAPGGAHQGLRAGPSSEERDRIKALEREVRDLRQANEILRKASAYFAMAELDRRSKP
jgi:transposase-like protein